jgi:FkbM family methyltransferase
VRCADPVSALRWLLALAATLPTVIRTRSLVTADRAWVGRGGVFKPAGTTVRLPGSHTPGAREMYCRDVYLRSGLTMPAQGWVLDLGANRGLFSVWAACAGAQAVAIDAQQRFADETRLLAEANDVADRVHTLTAMVSGDARDARPVGVLADDARWASATHAVGERPGSVSIHEVMTQHGIDRVGLMKVDIEGGEFSVFSPLGDLSWLDRVDQIALEVHPPFGDVGAVVQTLRGHGFSVLLEGNEGEPVGDDEAGAAAYAYASRDPR